MMKQPFQLPPLEDPHADTRRKIQEHPSFSAWYKSLGEDTRTAFELLFLNDVTPELIEFVRQVPESEWWQSIFLRVISDGNPDPFAKSLLTQEALLTVIADMESLGRPGNPPAA